MEFLNIVNAIASHVNADNIELVIEMVEKLIVLGEQMEASAVAAVKRIEQAVEVPAK